MFFGLGRKPLLDFLRNLTPQIIMLTIALVAGSKLDLGKFDLSLAGLKRTLPFAMCMLVFFISLIANLSTFLEESLEEFKGNKASAMVATEDMRGAKRIWALLVNAWSNHKLAVFRMVLVMTVAEAAISVVFIMSIQSAVLSPFLHG
ncbi:hypothetical protein ACPCIT_02370 [Pseudomonas siliginis]|uniref:hypothetical protein n=1 Tax=Pseudomonas TaxID=286 RepID=UPI001F408511|nr:MULTISPECIES: hypothetical protein [Pseudomonas]MEB2652642.1 hypothetical protein [Pseudomonas siliginis]UVL96563.1 hypothetical protein LOY48_10775 [Pseudomonas siliginis]